MSSNVIHHRSDTVKKREQEGWDALRKENFSDAIRIFEEVFRLDPKNVAAYQGTTAALRGQGKLTEAETLLAAARADHPKEAGLLAERAWLALARKDYDGAIQAFDARLEVPPEEESLFRWRISLLRARERFEEAERRLAEAEALFPDNLFVRGERGWLLFSQRKYDKAITVFQEILAKVPDHDSALQGRVASLRMKGCFKEAARYADDAVRRCPKSPGVFSERAWLHTTLGDLTVAKTDLETALELAPKDPYGRLNVARTLVRRSDADDLDVAEDHCRAALAVDPVLGEAIGCLGVIARKQGRFREAEAHLLRSIEIDPMRGCHGDLAELYFQMGRYDEAKGRLDEAFRINPANLDIRMQMGKLHLLTDKYKEAIREYRSATAIDPWNSDAHKALAIALIEAGEVAEAERVLRAAIGQLDAHQSWELRLTLCRLLAILGDDAGDSRYYDEALQEAAKAVRFKSRQPSPHFHEGIVRFKMDDLPGALRSFRKCLSLDKENVMAEINAERIRARLREKSQARVTRRTSIFLMIVFTILAAVLWTLRVFTEKVSETTFVVLTPVLLGLLVAAPLLPWLTRLKLTGLEAELSEPKPKETLPSGPSGEIGFIREAPKGL